MSNNPNFAPTYSTDEIYVGEEVTICLTDELVAMNQAISTIPDIDPSNYASANHNHDTAYAPISHTHNDYASSGHNHNTTYAPISHSHSEYAPANHEHSGYASSNHTHSGYATADHTHTEYATANHEHSGYAPMIHTHYGYATADHTHTEYALASHEHSGYASINHIHSASDVGAAAEDHTHSDYAPVNHTHSGYADADHTHSEYFSANGGIINGDTNVDGVLKAKGQQAFYYDSATNTQTIGTNNASGGTTICCGANGTTAINGALAKTPTIVPRTTNTYYCGNSNFRWKGIYSTSAVNVSSDARLKRDVVKMDEENLAQFVSGLNVVSYNYINDPEDANSRIGLVAQAVQSVDPELAKFFVDEDETGMLSLKPADLVFPLIAAVKKLTEKVQELSAKVEELSVNNA